MKACWQKAGIKTLMSALLSLIVVFLISGISHAEKLKIGLIPEQNVFKQLKRYKPLGEYIQNKTGIIIEFTMLPRYGNIIDSFNDKKLDGAFWGSFTGAMAIEKLGIQPIARPVNLDGTSSYRGYIFVHKYSIIDSVERMRNTVIAFVDKATTAGYIFPMAYLKDHGVNNIDTYFQEYYFTGSHDAAIYAVLNKEADIGCAKNTIFEMLARENPKVKDDLVILAKSPDVPSNALGLRKGISAEVKEKLKRSLLDMENNPEGLKVLKELAVIKFVETTEKDYSPVFVSVKKAGINLKTYNYINK